MIRLIPRRVYKARLPCKGNFRIVNPHGITAVLRYKTAIAAWGRICSYSKLANTAPNRSALANEGWIVREHVAL